MDALAARICASRTFRNSESLRRLLLFLAKRSQQSPDSAPKEYEIAVEVLERPPDFDPRVDSAVRVVTSRLRSKLTEYYSDEGRNDPVMLELQRGVYNLRLRHAAVTEEPAPASTRQAVLTSPWVYRITAACIAVAIGFAAFHFGRLTASSGTASNTRWTPAMNGFWQPFVSSGKPTVVVLGTPLMLRSDSGTFFRDHRFNDWNEPGAAEKRRAIEQLLRSPVAPSYRYTGVGEAAAAFQVGQLLAGRGQEPALRRSSAFAWDALRMSNVVFIGAPKWNPQIHDLPIEQELMVEGGDIINRHPRPGEQPVFGYGIVNNASWDLVEGYALITRVSGLPGYGGILALSSAGTEGAWAAAEYVSRAEHLDDIFRRLRTADGSWPPSFQVVIRAKFNALVPVSISYVTHRVLTTGSSVR